MLYKRAEKILKKLLSFSEKPNLAFEFNQIIKASLKRISGDKLESDLEFLTKEGLIGFVGINSYQAIYVTNSGYTYFDEKHSMNKTIHRTELRVHMLYPSIVAFITFLVGFFLGHMTK
ncbi:hypothetical protein [Lactiplantibacillus plantarum]|uniref:hypothetical protein n=1 Tax=Lactiplantibacillus plantarum TaxID=1590 RepID=UPI000B3EC6C0|nr:hypothetical protein [Lactiplantibacillus plantarum]ARW13396.1 hypothetical protein S100434_01247 [Lactiplantibacillus plantarum subsp. plantarum]QHM20580.1 hypothetical protein C7M31_00016 [Lactiplantibacillus plantarum]QHM26493.1 hypothetical protein C7M33_00015 [Lactiplantibacillus plantarum]GIQ94175.1 hypothetical protein COY2906_10450 [Lactiplantibacillus plantarum]